MSGKRTRQERVRLGVLFVFVLGFFTLTAARLIHLQVFLGPRYSRIVERQSSARIRIPAERGIIYDRQGKVVARNVMRHSLYAYPETAKELRQVAAYLDQRFGYEAGKARRKFNLNIHRFSYIKRRLTDSAAARFAAEVPPGLHLRDETYRDYPYGTVGKQILGFTNIDNNGLSGFEYSFDSLLAGSPGYADVRRDGLSNTYRVQEKALVKPVPGKSVVLTIDWRMQEIVEQELKAAVEKYHAKSGKAVFLDCHTGDILAIAHFDPTETDPRHPTKLRAIADQFEPGSVMKAFGAAAMLDAGIIDFADSVFCENGRWRVGRRILHDDEEHGWLTFREILEYSSNIGIGKYGCKLGGKELVAAYHRFGMGEKTGCGLPGEISGRVAIPAVWSDYNISALAMGHSLAVNALQLATGMAAIANGGDLLRPRILLGEVGDDGNVVGLRPPEVKRRVMQRRSVDSLQAFLRGVVECGTATPVNSPVVAIAGKTGTAEVVKPNGRGYLKNRFTASFTGYFPAAAPIVAGVVVLDQPRPITYGGYSAGPAFRRIAERFSTANPDVFTDPQRMLVARERKMKNLVNAPDLIGRELTVARAEADAEGLSLRANADSGIVMWQFPLPDRVMFAGDEVVVMVVSADGTSEMADVRGLSLRKAAALLRQAGVQCTVSGSGRVVRQSIAPGRKLAGKVACELICKPG